MTAYTDESKELVLGPAISMLQVIPGRTTAEVRWTTDMPATSRAFVKAISETYDPALVTFHSVVLNGLSPATAYSLSVQSVADGIMTTQVRSFATSTLKPEAVVEPVSSQPADIIAELRNRIRTLTVERDAASAFTAEYKRALVRAKAILDEVL